MPTALVISRYFPPLGSAGASIRLVKLMKYASGHGWSFIVMTQDLNKTVIPESTSCEFLFEDVPIDTSIIRVANPVFNWRNSSLNPITGDSSIPWGINVILQSIKTITQKKPDLIFANTPPFTNIGVGYVLSFFFRIPFIVDIKDDWIGSPTYRTKKPLRQFVERLVERLVFRKASSIVTVTLSSYKSCLQRHPKMQNKIFIIPNGEDLLEYQNIKVLKKERVGSRFRVLSIAAGYRPGYRDLTPFITALSRFILRVPSAKPQIEIIFLGDKPDPVYFDELIKVIPISQVECRQPENRSSFVNELWAADLFMLTQWKGNFTAISGTLYEYWATGKAPIILFSEKGDASDLLEINHLGQHFKFDQVEEASTYLEKVFLSSQNGNPIWIDSKGVEKYDREKLTNEMVKIWKNIL